MSSPAFEQPDMPALLDQAINMPGEKPSDKHISQVFTATDQIIKAGREIPS